MNRVLRRSPPCLALLVAVLTAPPALAADRVVTLSGFDRVRVQGPYEVRVAASRLPVATLSGDQDAIDVAVVEVEGSVLTVRGRVGQAGIATRALPRRPVVVTVGTGALLGASVVGTGRISAARMAGARVDVSVTGDGAVEIAAVDAPAVNAQLIGGGSITLAGRAGSARLLTNGSGTVQADGLEAGDLFVRIDGPGTTQARARYTARVIDTGVGQITVAGRPKCTVTAPASAPVTCGAEPAAGSDQR